MESVARRYCEDCPAHDHGFCGRLPESLRDRFRDAVESIPLDCSPDEDGRLFADWDLAIVSRGTLSVRRAFEDGRRALTDTMFPGEVIHVSGGTSRRGRQFAASSDFRVCMIPDLDSALEAQDCHFLERYLRADALAHIEDLRDRVAVVSRLGPQEKLAYLLLDLQGRMNPEGSVINLPFSRSEIADMLGLRMETISRALFGLESANIIRRKGPKTIHILNRDALESVASG